MLVGQEHVNQKTEERRTDIFLSSSIFSLEAHWSASSVVSSAEMTSQAKSREEPTVFMLCLLAKVDASTNREKLP